MEKKNSDLLAIITSFLSLLFVNLSMAQNHPIIPVNVGLVLDMNNPDGQMGLNCVEMALSDFYATHSHYKSWLVIHTRDSKKDIVGAASAALDLLKNVQVQAIIGPLSSSQTNFVISLGDKAHVPVVTFSATSPSLTSMRSPYFIRATLNDSSQVHAIRSIVQAFGWREVVPIYVDNEFGEGIIPSLTDALEQVNAHVPYRSVISKSATDGQIAEELYKLMTMRTRVFVVHMLRDLGARLFTKAEELGMMSQDYVWVITDGMANELSFLDHSVIKSMLGVIGVRPHVPDSQELKNFTSRYKRIHQKNSSDLNIFGLWAYDSVTALALAVENAALTNATTFTTSNRSNKSTYLEDFGVSMSGTELVRALRRMSFKGLAGEFSLVNGQLQSPPYEIINLVGPGARVVGYWTQENGIVRDINPKKNNNMDTFSAASRSKLRSIIWPGDMTIPPKGWVIPTNGKKLRIGVPVKSGFTQFLNVTWNNDNSTHVEGYCRDVFDEVMGKLPYGVQYEYIPFASSNHETTSYNDLVYQVYLGKFDAAVADITIVANRSQYVDFTLPYAESGVYMVVPIKDDKSHNAWAFLKPLTWQLWLTSFSSFVLIGVVIWILERRINSEFRGPFWYQVGMIFWFAFSTMVFAHKEKIISNLARFVLIIWFLLVLILTQSYTASLTSMFVQKLQPTVTSIDDLLKNNRYVAYETGSFVFGLLTNMGFSESRLVAYKSPEILDELFSNGTIAAAFDEIPYMKLFLASHCSKYTAVDPIYKTDGYGFAFPIGSPLVSDVSRAILNVTESKEMTKIERKWFGDNNACPDSNSELTSSNSLGLESFWGLFTIVAIASCLAITIDVIRFLHQNWNVRSDARELFRRFLDRDTTTSHNFGNITIPKKPSDGDNCDCMQRALGSSSFDNHQSNTNPSSTITLTPPTSAISSPDQQNIHFQEDYASNAAEIQSINQRGSEKLCSPEYSGNDSLIQI